MSAIVSGCVGAMTECANCEWVRGCDREWVRGCDD